jgi:hypothetical protein
MRKFAGVGCPDYFQVRRDDAPKQLAVGGWRLAVETGEPSVRTEPRFTSAVHGGPHHTAKLREKPRFGRSLTLPFHFASPMTSPRALPWLGGAPGNDSL